MLVSYNSGLVGILPLPLPSDSIKALWQLYRRMFLMPQAHGTQHAKEPVLIRGLVLGEEEDRALVADRMTVAGDFAVREHDAPLVERHAIAQLHTFDILDQF